MHSIFIFHMQTNLMARSSSLSIKMYNFHFISKIFIHSFIEITLVKISICSESITTELTSSNCIFIFTSSFVLIKGGCVILKTYKFFKPLIKYMYFRNHFDVEPYRSRAQQAYVCKDIDTPPVTGITFAAICCPCDDEWVYKISFESNLRLSRYRLRFTFLSTLWRKNRPKNYIPCNFSLAGYKNLLWLKEAENRWRCSLKRRKPPFWFLVLCRKWWM